MGNLLVYAVLIEAIAPGTISSLLGRITGGRFGGGQPGGFGGPPQAGATWNQPVIPGGLNGVGGTLPPRPVPQQGAATWPTDLPVPRMVGQQHTSTVGEKLHWTARDATPDGGYRGLYWVSVVGGRTVVADHTRGYVVYGAVH